MTTPTAQPAPDARHATRAHAARTVGVVGALFVALIGIAGAISVADSGDWRADGLAVVVAAGAIGLAASLYRDLHQQARSKAVVDDLCACQCTVWVHGSKGARPCQGCCACDEYTPTAPATGTR